MPVKIGLIVTFIILHGALILCSWAWYDNLDPDYSADDPVCMYTEADSDLYTARCGTPGWAKGTPLAKLVDATPHGFALTPGNAIGLVKGIMGAILQMMFLNYDILHDTDAILGMFVFFLNVICAANLLLILAQMAQRLLGALAGRRGFT